MSKTIFLHRHLNLSEVSQEDPEVKAWFGQAYRPIGPYWNGKVVGTGLSFNEQAILMPEVIGVEAKDKDFRKAVISYFDNLLTNVPKEGLPLNISLRDDSQPLSADNLPENPKEYIIYRHAMGHPHLAANKDEAEMYQYKRFYLVNPQQTSETAMKLNSLEDDAMTLYFKYRDNPIKADQILTMMGVNIVKMKKEDKLLKLKSFTQKDSSLGEKEQQDKFKRFIGLCTDKDLEIKYMIEELVGAQVLKKVGTNILLAESGATLGENMEDAVLFLKSPKNSKTLNVLKSEYQMKVKTGVPLDEVKEVKEEA